MRYTYNISDKAIVSLIINMVCDKYPYGGPVEEVATMLTENILGSTHYHWIELIEDLARKGYFIINNGKIYT